MNPEFSNPDEPPEGVDMSNENNRWRYPSFVEPVVEDRVPADAMDLAWEIIAGWSDETTAPTD